MVMVTKLKEMPTPDKSGSRLFKIIFSIQIMLQVLIFILRVLEGPVPEELLVLEPLPDEQRFPDNMFDDIITLEYQIDIDRRPRDNPDADQDQNQVENQIEDQIEQPANEEANF